MFQAVPGVNVEWPAVLYPAPLPQYEGLSAPKPAEPPETPEPKKDAAVPGKTSGVRQAFLCWSYLKKGPNSNQLCLS